LSESPKKPAANAKAAAPATSAPSEGADIDALLSAADKQRAVTAKSNASKAGGSRVRDLWQAPALVLGAALLVGGVIAAFSTKPPFDVEGSLARAEALVEEGEPGSALSELNGELLDILGVSEAPEELRQRFHRSRAAAMYLEMRGKGLQSDENYRRILEELATLESLGMELDAAEIARSIEAHLALGENDEAIRLVNTIDPSDGERRQRMLKLVIRAAMSDLEAAKSKGGSPERFEQALTLLTRLASAPSLDERDRIWTIARQAELRLAAGYNSETVAHLLREMQRIDSLQSEEAGELYVLLGRAYYNLGQYTEAAQRLSQADMTLSPTDENRSTTNVLLGRIAMLQGDAELARDRFAFVTTTFGGAKDVNEAWLGLAEAEAILGNFDAAGEAYKVLVENLRRSPEPDEGRGAPMAGSVPAHAPAVAHGSTAPNSHSSDPHGVQPTAAHGAPQTHAAAIPAVAEGPPVSMALTPRLMSSLRSLAIDRLDAGDPASTLRFAQIAESLRGAKESPDWTSLLQARAYRTQADTLANDAAPGGDRSRLSEADPVTLREIKSKYVSAANEYRRHSRAVIGSDDDAFGESLWNAADSADLAGDYANSVKWFGEYVNGRPIDPRRDSARFRIAKAHQATGDLAPAIDMYRELIASNPSSGEGFRSYVPLAQCLMTDSDPGNDLEAENLIRQVLAGSILPPEAPEFRIALDEFGRFLVRAKRYPEAIARLTESLERYPNSADAMLVRFKLAEALRLSAAEITGQLTEAMPESQRRELERLRRDRLRMAMGEYERVALRTNEPIDPHVSGVERNAIRNAFFFRADCAYDLGEFDRAIEFYDAAAQRFSDDPASLVAMVQIVNAYAATDRWTEARTAHERARQRFRELPPEAFDRPDMPMDRRHWERWLDSVAELAIRSEN
jgi:tetratricopeptide (TPR) repeat protein